MILLCQKNGFLHRNILVQEQQVHSSFKLPKLPFRSSRQRITVCATTDENIKEKSTDISGKEGEASSSNSPPISSSSPFVGAKISSRIAARSTSNNESNSKSSSTTKSSSFVAPPSSPKVASSSSQIFQGSSTITSGRASSGLEKLKSTKPASVFLDSQQRNFKQPGPKDLLNTLRKSEIDSGKTTKFGQPVVPSNLFDEPKRIPSEDKAFEFSFNAGQLVLVFSFLTIIGIMLGTAFLVWKVGAIHYNEY